MVNDHIMIIQICAKPLKITVVQAFAPTTIYKRRETEGAKMFNWVEKTRTVQESKKIQKR